ncbi:MAG TPA: YbjQ family protein [Polyangiaceae bacterium]|jgi:uncharacterized protein YbjQ (UPF0145 family)
MQPGSYPHHPHNLPPAPGWPIHPAMVTVGFEIPLFRIVRSFGIVRGLVVRSPGIGGGFMASFEAMGGGNVDTLIQVCEKARGDAFVTMLQHAAQMGANGIIGMRYDATEMSIGQRGLTEVLAYGVAVWAEPAG